MGHSGGGDTNLVSSLVFHNLNQGHLLVMVADFPASKTSVPAKTHQFAITIWGVWEILPVYWEINIYGRNRKANLWAFNIAPTDS